MFRRFSSRSYSHAFVSVTGLTPACSSFFTSPIAVWRLMPNFSAVFRIAAFILSLSLTLRSRYAARSLVLSFHRCPAIQATSSSYRKCPTAPPAADRSSAAAPSCRMQRMPPVCTAVCTNAYSPLLHFSLFRPLPENKPACSGVRETISAKCEYAAAPLPPPERSNHMSNPSD